MATENKTVGASWSKIVDNGQEFFLSLPFESSVDIELATVAAAGSVAAGVVGHVLRSGGLQEMSRGLIGPGDVHARCRDGSVPVVVSAWT